MCKERRERAVSIRFTDEEHELIELMRERLGFTNNAVMTRTILMILASNEEYDFLFDKGRVTTPDKKYLKMRAVINEYSELIFDLLDKQGMIKE